MKGAIESGYIMKAALCGFLIAFNTVLFMNYALDITVYENNWIAYLAIDIALILLVAYPFKEGGVIAVTIIFLVFGYVLYMSPIADELVGPVNSIKESMSDMPGLAEKQMHCMMLIFTNPMAYQRECGFDPDPLPEEKPEDFGLEITEFEIQPDTEVYAKMPIQIWTVLENKGDYPAVNVMINSTGKKYRNCKLNSLNITRTSGGKIFSIRPDQTHYYSMMGKVGDPWRGDGKCTYAQNKMRLDGTIETTYSYDYQTESYIELKAVRTIDEVKKFEVVSAKEKAAPANILMFTFVPLIWKLTEDGSEDSDNGYKEAIIPISFQNERQRDKISLRGKTVHYTAYILNGTGKWCEKVCSEMNEPNCTEDCSNTYHEEESEYYRCKVNNTDEMMRGVPNDTICKNLVGVPKYVAGKYKSCVMGEKNDITDKEECIENNGTPIPSNKDNEDIYTCVVDKTKKEIETIDESKCNGSKGIPIYKVKGTYSRTIYDKISLSIVGEQAKGFVELKCDNSTKSLGDDLVKCESGDNGEINLIWLNDNLEFKSGDKKLVYSGIIVSLKDGVEWPEEKTKMNFGVRANATYKVTVTRTNTFKVNNPHYTD